MALRGVGRGTRGAVHRHGLEILRVTSTAPVVAAYGILLESGSSLLQQNGDHLLLEFNHFLFLESGDYLLLESGSKFTKEA